ncbi:hypothetical protein CDD81_2460 [Ophiocordyceps australis]|uniref:DNA replication checkpoint mediator MRC1 domain-containing protein n=1 Tax=Ophiocordyceps australis TaxID=1399860 RepID=A0A2C5XYQ0_9HYPO|nr:hypothetical protein CDD81_2460 [Ophiocordyceps australis]
MASFPAASSISDAASPDPPTPRSKIRALLATVPSDDEADTTVTNGLGVMSPSKPTTEHQMRADKSSDSEQESDESDVPVKPRGKLASRMRGASSPPIPVSNTPSNHVQHVSDTEKAAMHDEPSDDDDQDLPIVPRRLKRRTGKQDSPTATDSRAPSPSPGLFVSSPIRPSPTKNNDSGSDNDLPTIKSDRFKELVERKRQERLAREAAAEAEKAQERARQDNSRLALESDADDDGGITEDEDGRRLSQAVRPKKRKASKKAIEEMNRETQRMARSMQLSHEPRTRKKIAKSAFFEKFCYKSAMAKQPEPMATSSSRPTSSYTEMETKAVGTPPSSPPALKHHRTLSPELKTHMSCEDDGNMSNELPFLDEIVKAAQEKPRQDKGKARATDMQKESATEKPKRRIRVRMPVVATTAVNLDSDDELEVTKKTQDKIKAVFDNAPSEQTLESRSLRALRALAQIKSPPGGKRRKNEAPCMTAGQLHLDLVQKARQQAKIERQRRLELLKSQGIEVQSAAERERQEQEVEDLVAKAREEARLIMQQERDAAKQENKGKGETDIVDWDDSEDEEYEEAANESDGEASAIQLSGSEEEQEDEEEPDDYEGEQDEDMPDADEPVSHPLLDQDAKSDESEAESNGVLEDEPGPEAHQDSDEEPRAKRRRNRKHTTVMSDDEAVVEATPRNRMANTKASPYTPRINSDSGEPYSVLRSARKSFIPGLPVNGPAGMGLTQIFAGTMDDEEQTMSPLSCPQQSLMPDIDVPPQWARQSYSDESSDDEMIMDSQQQEPADDSQRIQLNASQSQMRGLDSLLRDDLDMQPSQFVFTQDNGPQIHTPIKQRYIELPHSTVDTLLVSQHEEAEANGSPVLRKGRLRRKVAMPTLDEEEATGPDAFAALADGAKEHKKRRRQDQFNRNKSKAKEMMEEQAEESEDEYAGLGGADGEDSDNESAGSVEEIIDDEAGNEVDERKLAAFYADRERAQDEKEVEKLFKDITKGMLRRKRGADFDLSDSDDGGAAQRRMKRRQFNKMQKALFADERIKKIAQDPGNQAFLRTIEDHGSDDELEVVEATTDGPEVMMESQDDGPALVPDSQQTHKKALGDDSLGQNARRTKNGKKPSNIGEVRQTLSSLLAERETSVIPATVIGSDSEDDESAGWPTRGADKENAGRRAMPIVDRISLKRTATDPLGQSRLAFAASSSTTIRIPALLRRATTNSSLFSGAATAAGASASSASAPGANTSGGFGDSVRVHKGATKSSGVSGFGPLAAVARAGVVAPERRLEGERRRELKKARGAQRRIEAVGGLLGKGSFE